MHRTRDVLRQWSLVIERRSMDMPHEFEGSVPKMLQCALMHLRPVHGELLLCGYNGIRQQLEDVLARDANVRLAGWACRDDRWRSNARRTKLVSQSLEDSCAQ